MQHLWSIWVVMCLLLVACVSPTDDIARRGVDVVLTEAEPGKWRLDYVFTQPVTTVVFRNSYNDAFRAGWDPIWETPPVERRSGLDTIFFERPTRTATFWLDPAETGRSIDGFIDFGIHGTAISTWQFAVSVVTDRTTVSSGHGGLGNVIGYTPDATFTLSSPWPKYYNGARVVGDIALTKFEETYIYVGDLRPFETLGFNAILDAEIPTSVTAAFKADMANINAYYSTRLSQGYSQRSTVFFNYDRNRQRGGFQGRVAEDGTMVLSISGSLNELQLPRHRAQFLHFFAHEAAHNQLDATIWVEAGQRDAWISEGFAEAMAFEVLSTEKLVDTSFIQREYRRDFKQCAIALQRRSLHNSVGEAHYSCGNLLAVMIASMVPNHDIYQVWTALKVAQDEAGESALSHRRLLACLEDLGASPEPVRAIKTLIMDRQGDSGAALREAMTLSGLTFEMADEQTLNMIELR